MTIETASALIKSLDALSELAQLYETDKTKESLDKVAEKLEEIGLFSGEHHMSGFQDVCFLLQDFLLETPEGSVYKATQRQQLFDWIDVAKNYVGEVNDENSEKVLNIFKVECWPAPLTNTDTDFMKEMLLQATPTSETDSDSKKTDVQESSQEEIVESTAADESISDIEKSLASLNQIISTESLDDTDSLTRLSEAINTFAQIVGDELSLGFQDICLLLDENIVELIEQNIELNNTQKTLLISWIGLAGKYIKEPSNQNFGSALLSNLENQQWPTPLAHEDAVMIAGMMGIKLPEEPIVDEVDDNELSELDVSDDPLDSLSSAITNYKANDDVAFENIISSLEKLAATAVESSSQGLEDLCLFLQQNLEDISADDKALSTTQIDALKQWVIYSNELTQQPENKAAATSLIKILTNDYWPTSLTDTDVTVLNEVFGISDSDVDSEVTDDDLASEDSTDQENLDSTEASADNPLSELQQALEDLNIDDAQSVTSLISHFEDLSARLAEFELEGLEDVCLLLQQNLEDISDDNKPLTYSQLGALKRWSVHTENYIADPEDKSAAGSLINVLTEDHWSSALTDTDTSVLKEVFGIIDEKPEPEIEPEPTPAPTVETADSVTPESIETPGEDTEVTAEACPVSPMLIEMLVDEIKHIEADIDESVSKITSNETDENLRNDSLSQLAVKFERFGNACQAAELAGLYQASEIIHKNIGLSAAQDEVISDEQGKLISSWPKLIHEYLLSLGDNGTSQALTDTLKSDCWKEPLIEEVTPALVDLLNAPYSSDEEAKETRQTEATAEDVSLELPSDISQELLDGLLQELPGQTEGFSSAIQAFLDGSGDNQDIEKAQRIAHTVKGAANTVGIRGIATLTHQLEDIFLFLNANNKLPSQALSASLINASDCLEEMSESLISQGEAPGNAQEILQDILNWINRLESEGVDILEDDMPTPDSGSTSVEKDDSKKVKDEPQEEEAAIATLRVPAPIIDDLIRLLGETIILTTQLQEKIQNSTDETEELIQQNEASHELINQLEQQVELRAISSVPQAVNQNEVFDSLELEQYNELNTITNQLAETTLDSVELNRDIKHDLRALDELLVDQSRLHREVQGLVMRTRMVPIKTITPRLQRSVRQTCRAVGKQAALHLHGTETLMDSDILNNLVDPLIHMLRNSLDHGIEERDERINKGKEPEGKIELSFAAEGTQIVVRCKDDGAGLDHEAIRVTAIKRGILDPDEKPGPLELDRMILRPGFSTSKTTTQVSGRGIGMDLVYTKILENKGTLHIESEKDQGCLMELRMPVTLISSHVLMIRHRNKMLAVSSRGVEQILHPSDSQIVETEDGLICKVDEESFELNNLEDLIDFPGDRRLTDRETRPALLVREEDINRVVYIQEIVDSRELVIKSMGKHMGNIPGIPGATILGDGSVVPVLDIPDLLRAFSGERVASAQEGDEHGAAESALPTALVVDDSLSARRALAQTVKDAGYDVRTAKDGVEAVEIIDKKVPDILLVDMEMPRMNGMELTAHVRANDVTKDIPVIMVTSRSTEKHREQASAAGVNVHLTKPFSEDELLDHVANLLNQ